MILLIMTEGSLFDEKKDLSEIQLQHILKVSAICKYISSKLTKIIYKKKEKDTLKPLLGQY